MRGHGRGLCGAAIVALVAGQPALSQDMGGLQLTLGVTQRLDSTENADLVAGGGGHLAASTTSLSFGLSSETRTQVLRLNLTGALRFEQGDGGAEPDRFDNPSLDAFYSVTGANSALTMEASASRGALSQLAPTVEDPDPQGLGTVVRHDASVVLDLGTSTPLGLTLQASHGGSTYSDATQTDDETLAYSATGHLRFASGAEARLSATRSEHSEDGLTLADDLTRDTTGLSLGWTQPLSPVLTLDASIGQQRVETTVVTTEVTEGLSGNAGLTLELANGSAGLSFAQSQESGGARQTLSASRSIDLGNQSIALTLGATRRDDAAAVAIGSLRWVYEAGGGSVSFDLGRGVQSAGLADEVTTDRLALGLRREIGAGGSLNLDLVASRIDDSSDPLVERTDISASYSRDLGQDWLMTFGANMTLRAVEGSDDATSRSIFLALTRNFSIRP